jgi:hypothetical protein
MRRLRISRFLLWGITLCLLTDVRAQGSDIATLKARLALAVARFAELPAAQDSTSFRFCVATKAGAIPSAFHQLAGQRIGGRVVEVLQVPGAVGCDVLFVAEGAAEWRAHLRAAGATALTIGEVEGFLAAGGMIELVIENDTLRFDVNLEAARERRVRLPGQVLKLARRVQE